MKRLSALALAVLLLLHLSPAMAASTLMEKFIGQMTEQGFLGTVTFSAEGSSTSVMSEDAWAWLKNAAPRITVELAHSFARQADGQANMNLLVDGKAAGSTTLLYNASLVGLNADFLSDAWYTFARGWDASQLLQLGLTNSADEWPPIWHLMLAVQGADDKWKARAEQHYAQYETRISAWMNNYATLANVKKSKTNYTELRFSIPAADVIDEIKSLIHDLYKDQDLLSLLREVATSQEAAAYLQPGMEKNFDKMLNQLPLKGTVKVVRRLNADGTSVLDQFTLPFANNQSLEQLVIKRTPKNEDEQWELQGKLRNGQEFDVTCLTAQGGAYSGAVTWKLPATDEEREQTIAFHYTASWDEGKEEYSLADDRFTQVKKGSITIRPDDDQTPAQSLTVEATFSSTSSLRSPSRVDAVLTWQDLDFDAKVTATLSGRTAAPREVTQISSLKKPQRIDQMKQGDLRALLSQWQQQGMVWVQDLAEKLLPASLPDETQL